MKKIYINYANDRFKTQQNFALKMALSLGKFDTAIGYSISDLDEEFYLKNSNILDLEKGIGLWLWKPYIILKTLLKMEEGDVLLYADAGSFLVRNIDNILDELLPFEQDVMAFELPLVERQWTKADLFVYMQCNNSKIFSDTNQINSSFHLVKKSNFSVKFYQEFLELACIADNISDENIMENIEGFVEHRYDQSIFSLLYKKYKLVAFKDPTQFGMDIRGYTGMINNLKCNLENGVIYQSEIKREFILKDYAQCYNMIIFHNRTGNPIFQYGKYLIKKILSKMSIYNNPIV